MFGFVAVVILATVLGIVNIVGIKKRMFHHPFRKDCDPEAEEIMSAKKSEMIKT